MANSIQFKALNEADLQKSFGNPKLVKDNHPKAAVTAAALKTKLKSWQNSQVPEAEAVKLEKLSAPKLKVADVTKLRAISESATPTGEALLGQKMEPEKIVSTLFTSLSTLEFTKMQSEFKTRLAAATTPAAKAKVQAEWNKGVKSAIQVFASAGLPGLKEADLNKFSQDLQQSKANFNAVVKIANSGVAVPGLSQQAVSAATVLKGGWVPVTGVVIDNAITSSVIPALCSVALKEGSFTKHFQRSFSLTVRLPYWCPTWSDWGRICHKNITLAGASFSVDVSVGYRVTCCGAIAWGRASAQACVTILGFKFCAGCTASITGVAGFGRTPSSGGNCTYGLGINAQLKCTFGSITVLNLQAPFGWNITAPCPPAGFCN